MRARLNAAVCARVLTFAFATVVILTGAVPSHAAGLGAIRGTVADTSGKPIAGAFLAFVSADHSYVARTDRTGFFELAAVVPGTYVLSARGAGFSSVSRRSITVTADTTIILALQLAAQSTTALVSLGTVRVNGHETLSRDSSQTETLDSRTLAAQGASQLTQALAELPGVTLSRSGGSPALPVSLSLRGADPKEATVDIDGHQLNNGNTGDFDISVLDPAQFSSAQVVYGLAPNSLLGADTEGGAVNFRTLEPTTLTHGFASISTGSFDTNALTLEQTGSARPIGYALQARRLYQDGEVADFPVIDAATGQAATLGSAIALNDALFKVRYPIAAGDGFLEATYLTFDSMRDLSAGLSAPVDPAHSGPGQAFTSFAGSTRLTANDWYAFDARLPLGPHTADEPPASALTLRHLTTLARQTVTGPAIDLTPFLMDSADAIDEDSALFERTLPQADIAIQADVREEQLTLPDTFGRPSQFQRQWWLLGRYNWNTDRRLQYTAALFYTNYDTFGTVIDPRLAMVWSPNPDLVVRASFGTGFQPPALTNRFVPSPLPPPDARGLINIGNPGLLPDRTTEYELGAEHLFGSGVSATRAQLDVYRVNHRDDEAQYIPANASPSNPQLSYPVNVANAHWFGVSANVEHSLGAHTTIDAGYDFNSAYPLGVPVQFVDPQNANIVPGQQYEGVPLHRARLAIKRAAPGKIWWSADAYYESVNNDLNRPAFAIVDAAIGVPFGRATVVLSGSNLTNVYADRFTLLGAGVPYPGEFGPLPTDAYSLPGRSVTVTFTQGW